MWRKKENTKDSDDVRGAIDVFLRQPFLLFVAGSWLCSLVLVL